MLWEIVAEAFRTLLHWEVYIAAVIYLVILVGPIGILSGFAGLEDSLLLPIVQSFLSALGILTFVLLILPIGLGIADDTRWTLPLQLMAESPLAIIKKALWLIVASVAVSLVPIIGRLHFFSTFLIGIFATSMVFELIGLREISRPEMIPSFSLGVGLILLSLVLSGVFFVVVLAAVGVFSILFGQRNTDVVSVVSFPLMAVIGFIPLILYLAWLGQSLR